MGLFSLEQSKAAYYADFAVYGLVAALLAAYLLVGAPQGHGLTAVALACTGLCGWTAIEYGMHRFVFHAIQPFRRWHGVHHQRPTALIGTPTVVSLIAIGVLVFLPVLALGTPWSACALTLGVLVGYLGYSLTHHAVHHWHGDSLWLKQRKHWHALHHHSPHPGCFGVTSSLWDHIGRSARRNNTRNRPASQP